VFAIDIETCGQCGGRLRVIASIEEPDIGFERLEARQEPGAVGLLLAARRRSRGSGYDFHN
jgi:hypothetical protein